MRTPFSKRSKGLRAKCHELDAERLTAITTLAELLAGAPDQRLMPPTAPLPERRRTGPTANASNRPNGITATRS
ncbi:hypothetical protein [Streptomyces sp. NPDC050528]|uniref:hypothetical protein n=1 Tax=Streptomyces sp. NPDC050528 TaxID=3365623 RepID=UPI0037B28D71